MNLLVLSEDRGESHYNGGQCRLDVLIGIGDQVLHTGQDVGHDDTLSHIRGQVLTEI